MKLTRYYQSCILYENNDTRILIDPSGEESDRFKSFGKLDAVLYTHKHADHFDAELAKKFHEAAVSIYANINVAEQLDFDITATDYTKNFEVGTCAIQAIELPHCLMPDGSEGPQNTGYFINGEFFHPGDGVEISGFTSKVLAAPINGPDISMKDSFALARSIMAEAMIPIHYSTLGGKPEMCVVFAEKFNQPFKVVPLDLGESTEF